jgi:hypothetical protein
MVMKLVRMSDVRGLGESLGRSLHDDNILADGAGLFEGLAITAQGTAGASPGMWRRLATKLAYNAARTVSI